MKKRKVCIIGGGASGMIAAVLAARKGAAVTVLEHNDKVGKKILATGNGRCNLTNLYQDISCYHSSEQQKAWEILQQFNVQQTIRFFSELGLYTKNKNGGLYPFSMQAQSVRELLEMEARHEKVKIKCKEHVKEILPSLKGDAPAFQIVTQTWTYESVRELLEMEARHEKVKIKCKEHVKEILPSLKGDAPAFQIVTQTWTYEADAVILACGSKASLVEGADGSGYELAKKLGLSMRNPLPALVPLKGKGNYAVILACGSKASLVEGADGSGYELAKKLGLSMRNPLPALVPLKGKGNFFSKWAGTRTEGKISLFAAGRLVDEASGELQLTEYGISGIPVFQVSSHSGKQPSCPLTGRRNFYYRCFRFYAGF